MSRKIIWVVFGIVIFCSSTVLLAQMRGGSGQMGGGSGQMGQSGPMQGSMGRSSQGGAMGQGGLMMTRDQRRQMMHTSDQQDRQYRSCAQALERVRGKVHHMSQSGSKQPANAQTADSGSDQLDSDVQDLTQDQNDFLDGLNTDQQAALAAQIKDLKKKTSELAELSKQVKADVADKNADAGKIKDDIRRLDKLSKAIEKEQHAVAMALGIEG